MMLTGTIPENSLNHEWGWQLEWSCKQLANHQFTAISSFHVQRNKLSTTYYCLVVRKQTHYKIGKTQLSQNYGIQNQIKWAELLLSRNQCFCVKTNDIELNF